MSREVLSHFGRSANEFLRSHCNSTLTPPSISGIIVTLCLLMTPVFSCCVRSENTQEETKYCFCLDDLNPRRKSRCNFFHKSKTNKVKRLCVSFRMIPANHKYFLLSDLASSRDYELCVLAVYDDGITALTGTKLVGCVSFSTESEYGRCHSIRDQVSVSE